MRLRLHCAGIEVPDMVTQQAPEPGGLPFAEDLLSADPLMQAHRRNMQRRMNQDASRRRN